MGYPHPVLSSVALFSVHLNIPLFFQTCFLQISFRSYIPCNCSLHFIICLFVFLSSFNPSFVLSSAYPFKTRFFTHLQLQFNYLIRQCPKYFCNLSRNGKHGYLQCENGKFVRGIYRAAGSQAFFDTLKNVECCKPTSHSSSYGGCYTFNVPSFDTPGLAKCDDHYFITLIRVTHCRQLYCVDRLRCCKMETGISQDWI